MNELFVVFKTYKDGSNTLHYVFDNEKSAERSVRGIVTRYKTHRSITGGFYEKYRRDSITEKDLEGLMVFGWGGYLEEKHKRVQNSYFKSGEWVRG